MDELTAMVRLNRTLRIGAALYQRLQERFGSPEGIFRASRAELTSVEGIGPALAEAILKEEETEAAGREIAEAAKRGFRILTFRDPAFPAPLADLPLPPLVLYLWGDYKPEDRMGIGIVGSRRASIYGRMQAERFARELAEVGFTIVSGMARGVDAAAHEGALKASGRTIAVWGSGLLRPYPPEHRKLAERIAKQGAVLSEFPLETRPLPQNFPRRNRLISGLSLGLLVAEAAQRSGAMITVGHALEQGRPVFAIPGRIDNPFSQGPHQLLRDGTKLVETVEDVVEELSEEARAELRTAPAKEDGQALAADEKALLERLGEEPAHADELATASGLPAGTLAALLTRLELKKRLKRLAGGFFART